MKSFFGHENKAPSLFNPLGRFLNKLRVSFYEVGRVLPNWIKAKTLTPLLWKQISYNEYGSESYSDFELISLGEVENENILDDGSGDKISNSAESKFHHISLTFT